VGIDARAKAMQRFIPGAMASWNYVIEPSSAAWKGTASTVLYTRAPSNYELGANGIHHGTFRFEQGNPELRPEKSVEGRFQAQSLSNVSPWSWRFQSFLAMHHDFIALVPSASFAPISHAGQVYSFTAVDAFRTGLESSISRAAGAWSASAQASILGQWDIATGLGLPFTTPPQIRLSLEHEFAKTQQFSIACKAISDARLTARNEASTEGAFLCEFGWQMLCKRGTWSLDIHNLFNVAWLDHTSAYRPLGLVAQGRWIQISFNTKMKHHKSSKN
jgi:iron complex outermembrane recepter protein